MVGLPAQREAITFAKQEFNLSERKACKFISVVRSSLRYKKRPDKNIEIKARMIHWSEKRPRYGHPRIHEMILRDGFKVNHKRTERLYFKELNLGLKGKKKNVDIDRRLEFRSRFQKLQIKSGQWISFQTNLALENEFVA